MNSKLNESLRIVKSELKDNKQFGSLFRFWVSQITNEIEQNTSLIDKESHELAIKCIKRIHQ